MRDCIKMAVELGFFEKLRLFVSARTLALKRRWALFTRGDFDPYPPPPEGLSFSPSEWTQARGATMTGALDLASVNAGGVKGWQKEARARFRELLSLPGTISGPEVYSETAMPIAPGYERRRVYLRFGPGRDAPVDIVWRDSFSPEKLPVVICMQGTNSGAHLNLGEVRMPGDVYKVAAGSALALQAADHGYLVVSFERACFGERRERHLAKPSPSPSVDAAFHLLNLGETVLGQTASELESLRLWIAKDIAPDAPVYIAGYSAAGTAAIAAAAACAEFAGIAVGGCVGMIGETVLRRAGGGYNDIPDILRWFEFDALLALVAPRPCVVVAGRSDHIWPHSGAQKVVSSAQMAWSDFGAERFIELIEAPGGHTYYPDLMWPAMRELMPPQ